MARSAAWHPRIFPAPFSGLLFDSHMRRVWEERTPRQRGGERDIVLDISALRMVGRPEARMIDGQRWELVRGERRPYRLRFVGAEWVRRGGPYADLDAWSADPDACRLFYLTHRREPAIGPHYEFITDTPEPGAVALRARGCLLQEREGRAEPVEYLRRWSAPPPSPARLVPHPARLHTRYGGDPVRIRLRGRTLDSRLFIGGLHHQHIERPAVDHVLNLCGVENPWAVLSGRHPADRFAPKGEMRDGMTSADLLSEARYIVEALRAGERVLVHCGAGINRSSTVCCAAVMLLEGLTPAAALSRIRRTHPQAYPDPYHWFALRQLHAQLQTSSRRVWREVGMAPGVPEHLRVRVSLG